MLSYKKEDDAVKHFVYDATREAQPLDTFKVAGGAAMLAPPDCPV